MTRTPTWTELVVARLPPEEQRKYVEHLRYEAIYTDLLVQMRVLLRAKGVTQAELAAKMETSQSAVSRMLNERQTRNLKLETLVRFARALDVDLQESLFDDPVLAPAFTRKRELEQARAVVRGACTWVEAPVQAAVPNFKKFRPTPVTRRPVFGVRTAA